MGDSGLVNLWTIMPRELPKSKRKSSSDWSFFGGILVQEMAKHINTRKVIIISSVKVI
jgi:hypothetical protein